MKVSEDWLDSLATKEIALTQSELEALQEKIVKEGWMPTSEHFSLHYSFSSLLALHSKALYILLHGNKNMMRKSLQIARTKPLRLR